MSQESRKKARKAIRRFESGRTDFEEFFDAQGVRTLMIREPEDPRFYRVEAEDENHEFVVIMTGVNLPAAQVRPEEHPADLPFLPEREAVLLRLASTGAKILRWDGIPEAESSFQELHRQLEGSGWEAVEEGAGGKAGKDKGATSLTLRKEDRIRTLALFHDPEGPRLVLTDDPPEKTERPWFRNC